MTVYRLSAQDASCEVLSLSIGLSWKTPRSTEIYCGRRMVPLIPRSFPRTDRRSRRRILPRRRRCSWLRCRPPRDIQHAPARGLLPPHSCRRRRVAPWRSSSSLLGTCPLSSAPPSCANSLAFVVAFLARSVVPLSLSSSKKEDKRNYFTTDRPEGPKPAQRLAIGRGTTTTGQRARARSHPKIGD